MIALNLKPATAATNSLAFDVAMRTNNNISVDGNDLVFEVPGLYEITGEVNFTTTTTSNTGIKIDTEDGNIGNPSVISAPSSGSTTATIPIYAVVNVEPSSDSNFVRAYFVPVGSPTIVNGQISIKQIR